VNYLPVHSAAEMHKAVVKQAKGATIIVKSAAVADYRPGTVSARKIKKGSKALTLSLERTIDILAELGAKKGNRILVGFAAETHNMREHAVEKLKNKNLDLIVANDVTRKNAGFGSDMNEVQLFFRDGSTETLPPLSKVDLAHILLDRISPLLKKRNKK
jgi:phosphopantothenoylcysteine decarboxylase/phosphopantothenate--cysteine ligase